MAMGANFPIAILPRIVTELGRVFELLLRNIRAESAKRLIVTQGAPGNRIVAVTETHEAAEAHDSVGHASGQLVDDEVIDLTDIPAIVQKAAMRLDKQSRGRDHESRDKGGQTRKQHEVAQEHTHTRPLSPTLRYDARGGHGCIRQQWRRE
jgi:hypothetical protein